MTTRRALLPLLTLACLAVPSSAVGAAAGPLKLDLTGHIGTGGESSAAGGFSSPQGVAVSPLNGDVYVADLLNHRIQEFGPDGKFLSMFGKEVNETKDSTAASQAEKDTCEAGTGDVCKAGVESVAAGEFERPQSVAVDPVSGNVEVAEHIEVIESEEKKFGQRVQEFTPGGKFVFEIGKEVNKTKDTNLCTEQEVEKEAVICGSPLLNASGLPEPEGEHGTFDFQEGYGNVLAAGGPSDLIYVGEAHRVQEFEADGKWHAEIPVSNEVGALAVDPTSGDVYLAEGFGDAVVSEFGPLGEALEGFAVVPEEETGTVLSIKGIAVDSTGDIAIADREEVGVEKFSIGSLYATAAGHRLITHFGIPSSAEPKALAFSAEGAIDKDEMYAAAEVGQEILSYTPKPVGEVKTGTATCQPGAEKESDATFACTFTGEANQYDVAKTEVWFQFGRTCALGSNTARQAIEEPPTEAFRHVEAVEALRPNSGFCFQLAAADENAPASEPLTGGRLVFALPAVPPNLVGSASALVGSPSSAVMSAELNPENAATEYYFEYAPTAAAGKGLLASCPGGLIKGESCPGVLKSTTLNSALYGKTGASIETTGLQPNTTYEFRLAAHNEAGSVIGATQELTTLPLPSLVAFTGGFSGVTTTSAVISGSVDTDGQQGTFSFQLGVYNPAGTQFGTVLSGSTGLSSENRTMVVSGLQPGTTYAYRAVVRTGNGEALGAPMTFTTEGVPAVLASPPVESLLAIPAIPFPTNSKPAVVGKPAKCKYGSKRVHGRSTCKPKPKKHVKHSKRHK